MASLETMVTLIMNDGDAMFVMQCLVVTCVNMPNYILKKKKKLYINSWAEKLKFSFRFLFDLEL